MKRIFAIGDIHGEHHKLERLLEHIRREIKPEETLVFVGDYIDRGPGSKQVVDLLLAFSQDVRCHMVCLMGNHDEFLLDSMRESPFARAVFDSWMVNGGRRTLDSYGVPPYHGFEMFYIHIPPAHRIFFETLVREYAEGRYLFVHAGVVPPGCPDGVIGVPTDQGMHFQRGVDMRLWIREPFLSYSGRFPDDRLVVFGHTVMKDPPYPKILFNKIGIDTGACIGGPLSCVVLDDLGVDKVIQSWQSEIRVNDFLARFRNL